MADPKLAAAYAPPYPQLGAEFASGWYLRIDDNIRVTSYNALAAVVLNVRYRFVDCDGLVQASQETQTPNTDRTAKSSIYPTPEGWLLGGEVFVSGAAPLSGQTYVVVEIVRGLGAAAIPLEVIAAGYATAKKPLRFPALSFVDSLESGGALRSIAGTTPAAGADISETVPTGARWELLAFRAQLVTSAVVATRTSRLTCDDGAAVYAAMPAAVTTPASTTSLITWTQGVNGLSSASNLANLGPIGVGLKLGSGHRIRTSLLNIDVGDQWSAIQYLVREWIEGA